MELFPLFQPGFSQIQRLLLNTMDYRKRSRVGLFCISWLFREFLFFLVPLSSHSRSCCQITSTASKQLPNEPLLCVQLPPSLHLLQPTTLYLYEPDSCPSDSKNAKSPLASSFLTFISRGIFGLRVWDVQHLWFTSYPPLLPPLSPSPMNDSVSSLTLCICPSCHTLQPSLGRIVLQTF